MLTELCPARERKINSRLLPQLLATSRIRDERRVTPYEWDEAKNESNQIKHGVDFNGAIRVFRDPHRMERLSLTENIYEVRRVVVGSDGADMLAVICTQRGSNTRIISARRARRGERKAYNEGRTRFERDSLGTAP